MTDGKAARAPVTLRLGSSEADVDAVLALCRLAHAESRYARLPFGMVRMRMLGLNMLKSPKTSGILMAERDGELLGCLIATAARHIFSDALYASAALFYVKPEARASRAAVALLEAFAHWARERGAVEASIHITSGMRQDEIGRFLERQGFASSGANYHLEL